MFGKETFTIERPVKSQSAYPVTWAFPNTYEVGMSSLGYQLVWWLLEQDCDLSVQRAFTNSQEPRWDEAELIGFTLPWELDYVNVLKLLQSMSIPSLSSQRCNSHPLVFGGGPALSANPETFAEFFDVILLGDAEVIVPRFICAWKEARQLVNREDQLLKLCQVEGVYVPSLYSYELESVQGPIAKINPAGKDVPAKVYKQTFTPNPDYVAHSLILAPEASWANMFLVEVARSCPQECRFCLASYLTRPFRAANVETLIEKIDLGLRYTKKIGLLGPSVTEHPQFDSIAQALLKRPDTKVSIASVRADTLNPLLLETLSKLGQRSVTIAIESGSERLRAIMKKNLTEEQIWQAVDLVDRSGLSGLKFYGIVGLPGEIDEDLDETVRLISALKKSHKRLHFVLGISSFVPKAQTPFQWAGRDRRCKEKLEYLRKRISKLGVEVRPESHNWSDIQTLLSRGDRRLTQELLSIAHGKSNVGAWRQALRNLPNNCPPADYYIYRQIPYAETLPWSHLVDEPKATMLYRHSQAASQLSSSS